MGEAPFHRPLQSAMTLPLAGLSALAGVTLETMMLFWLALTLAVLAVIARPWRWAAVFALAVLMLSGLDLRLRAPEPMPESMGTVTLERVIRIEALERDPNRVRFRGRVDTCPDKRDLIACKPGQSYRLSWYDPEPVVHSGQRWHMTLRLKPNHGYHNFNRFDYGAWLSREGYVATGYVLAHNARLPDASVTLRARLSSMLSHLDARGGRWLDALTLGQGKALTRDEWEQLRDTGTTHLFVVSGLHVGLIVGGLWWVSRRVIKLLCPLDWRTRRAPWFLAGVGALFYATLVGWGPAVSRATIMALIALWVRSGYRAPSPWQGWWLALVLVILIDPSAPGRSGFWLSFGAVAWLLLMWLDRPRPRPWVFLVRTQLFLTLAMAAMLGLSHGQWAPISLAVNLIAVPWVSVVMMPLACLAWIGVLSGIDGFVLPFYAASTAFWEVTAVAARLAPVWTLPEAVTSVWALGVSGAALCLLLPGLGLRTRGVCVCAMLCPVVLVLLNPTPQSFRVTVHDVGQGLAVSVEQAGYRVLYDTGARFRSGFAPISTLWDRPPAFDEVVVSHGDNDHSGGLGWLHEQAVVMARIWRPVAETGAVATARCRAGRGWSHAGTRFTFLWPLAGARLPEGSNDRSCVLLIEHEAIKILLMGDVGRGVERQLLERYGDALRDVDVMVASHHGSRTGSDPAVIRALSPRHVVFSAGKANRYGHPHPEVVASFKALGVCQWRSDLHGAVRFDYVHGELKGASSRTPRGIEPGCLGVESAR
ncbi:DNA internalization-related competence protein ComEC/Rec2 [Larsenimonas salina]|nr:DNA internalization-related competence protein ComEC/Rec2 [Larsenimonas salina]